MNTKPVIFIGPSLSGSPPLGMELRPPAGAGDLLALAEGPPRTVALIDGVFDAQAAVQHKEVLELLSRGFPVLGAASIGALRAAELHTFGMVGIGAVFEAYASNRIEADDEVVLLHAPAQFGYQAFSVPLVDVRATLMAATRSRRISPEEARIVRDQARACFWRDRTWDAVVDACRGCLATSTLAAFSDWLKEGQVSIKARDAAQCIAAAGMCLPPARIAAPPRTFFFLELAAKHGIRLRGQHALNPGLPLAPRHTVQDAGVREKGVG